MKWRVLDLFSGIGGFSLGLERAGMKTIAFCENDKFCRRVLRKHWPEVPILGDITKETFEGMEADVVVGGFPCQDISLAGKRAGLAGARSGLYRELVRAIRVVRPQLAIVENVAALLSRGLGTVLGDLAESGYGAEWDCVPACAVGAPHERDRIWIIAHAEHDGYVASALGRGPAQGEAKGRVRKSKGRAAPVVANPARKQVGTGRQSREYECMGAVDPDTESERWRPGRSRRLPDSFAGIRDEARRYASTHAPSKRLQRRQQSETPREALPESPRRYFWPWPNRWPDEPALSGVDDGVPDWVDRVKTTGNAVLPQIPEMIGRTIMENSRE